MTNFNKLIGSILLIAGTATGAGMLGLPALTAASGLVPTICVFFIIWAFMLVSGLLTAEVVVSVPGEVNFITLVDKILGKNSKLIAWLIFGLFLYALMSAYISGGTAIIRSNLTVITGTSISYSLSSLLFLLPFILCLWQGYKVADYVNRFFVAALIISYIGIIFGLGYSHDFLEIPTHSNWQFTFIAFPVIVTAFGFHLLIPSLKNYLDGSERSLKISIFWGSILPLIIYIIWEIVVLSIIPSFGADGLVANLSPDADFIGFLAQKFLLQVPKIGLLLNVFTFFALVSSCLGVALSLRDFLSDGLGNLKNNPILLQILVFLPPLIFVYIYPDGFLLALRYAGIFAGILLLVFPALMSFVVRSQNNKSKLLAMFVLVFGIFVIILELLSELHWLPWPSI